MSKYSKMRMALQDNEAGIAVVVGLLVLALLSLLGITLMGVSVTESQIGSNEADLKKAFFAAEAGIQEGIYRMRLDATTSPDEADTACTATADPVVIGKQGPATVAWADPTNAAFWTYNPPTCAWAYSGSSAAGWGNYFGGTAGNLNSAGRTFTSSGAMHGVGGSLINANLTNGGSYTVNVSPVVGYVGTCWQYVKPDGTLFPGSSCGPPVVVTTNPVFKVTSTGAARTARKVLSTMVRRMNVNPNPDAPLTANSDVEVTPATAVIDGRNYDCDGTTLTGDNNKPAVAAAPKPPPNETEPDIQLNNDENMLCEGATGLACGTIRTPFPPTIGRLLMGSSAPQGEVNAFDAYLASIKKTPGVDTYPENVGAPFHGILYVDGNYTQPPTGSTGILIVHNSTNTANLGNWNGGTFKGVVVADGINKINGNVSIVGAVFGWGSGATVEVDLTAGTPSLRWSKCVMDGLNRTTPFLTVKGTWHEQ